MATLGEIADQILDLFTKLSATYKANGWNDEYKFNQISGNMPAYTLSFIGEYVTYTSERVRSLSASDLKKGRLNNYLVTLPPILSAMQFNNFANDPDTVLGGLMMLLQMINARLPSEAKGPVQLDWDSVDEKALVPRDLAKRLRALEANITRLEPKAAVVDKKIADIEAAHATAEQLPEDLEELAAKRAEVKEIVEDTTALLDQAQKLLASIGNLKDDAEGRMGGIYKAEAQAQQLISRSENALRGSTGVGLANSFDKRKNGLSLTGLAWVVGLIGALVAAYLIGADRVADLKAQIRNDSPAHLVWMSIVLTVFGVGGPIWFAWLSTKQIGVTLRLAEDYAFKAAVSKAYEGYRKEAVDIDPTLKARLFTSALTRLEEAPIRLMDKENHSSPLQELLSNPAIRKSLEGIPGIADKIVALIPSKGGAAVVAPVAAAAALGSAVTAAKPTKKTKEPEASEE